MSGFAERRKFFLEVIDDMAMVEAALAHDMNVPPEQQERMAREDEAWQEALAEVEQDAQPPDRGREHSPEWFREEIEKDSDRELLLHRRFTAKNICKLMADLGFLRITPLYEDLLRAIERLREESGTGTPFREASGHLGIFRPPFATPSQLHASSHKPSAVSRWPSDVRPLADLTSPPASSTMSMMMRQDDQVTSRRERL